MSGHSAKRQKTTAVGSAGVPSIDALPPELLETICGFLDVGSLCTARLVCAQFHGAASRCIRSVELSVATLRSRPETTLNNFPNLSRVSVCHVKKDDLVMLAKSPVAAAVTHLRAVECLKLAPRRARIAAGLPLLPLPNLMSLTLNYADGRRVFSVPQTLRELALEEPVTYRTANLLGGLTNLTCLRFAIEDMRKPFAAVTALTALQRLEIYCALSLIPFVAELPLLTHLHFREAWMQEPPSDLGPLASLSRLHKLVHLGVRPFNGSLEHHVLASVATFTSLRSLDLGLCRRPERSAFERVCMAPFSQLTALTLTSRAKGLDASFLPRFNLEGLRDLSLPCGVELDPDGVTALRRATGLTQLQLQITASVGLAQLGIALPRLSRLRALTLRLPHAVHAMFSLDAIASLTELTRLSVSGRGVTTNADMEVCLGLKKLRVLRIGAPFSKPEASDSVTPETVFAIAKLPELRKFSIWGDVGVRRGHFTVQVEALLNAERHDKGWPPLDLHLTP